MLDILQFEFMRNALLAAVLVGIACGIVGTFVVTKRIVFMSGGIAHAAFGGVGLGYFLGINPVLMAIPFSVVFALVLGILAERIRIGEDSAIGTLWAIGMALGVLFIGLSPKGYTPDLFSYLFGSILTVPYSDIATMAVLDIVIAFTVLLFYREFQALSFDDEFSQIVGIPVRALYLLLLCLVALSIVVLIRVVGIVLVLALLTIPTITAAQFTKRMKPLMAYSTLIAVVLTVAGLWASYLLNFPPGATIVLVLAVAFFASAATKRFLLRMGKNTT